MYALVYVDDILVTGSSSHLVHKLINQLHHKFALKKLGKPEYFLGLEVHYQTNGSLILTQTKYIRDLLSRVNMHTANGVGAPMLSHCKPSKYGTDFMEEPLLYRSVVGALQYITLTRPDIAYSVNKVCQFMASPLHNHWSLVKRILRYLSGTVRMGLILSPATPNQPLSLRAYSDSDWANDPDDRRSTSGTCIFIGPNLISWSSKKQSLVAKSSAEAEYRALAHTTSEVLWLQSLLTELQIQYFSPTLLCDNLSVVLLSHNPVLHARTKHIELDLHFVREKVMANKLKIQHVPATAQLADILTKPLPTTVFQQLRDKLKVVLLPSP